MSSAKSKPKKTANQAKSKSPSPIDSNSVIFRGTICSRCREKVLTNQNGTIAIHEAYGAMYSPHGICQQATRSTASAHPQGIREPLIPDSVYINAVSFNKRHRKILDSLDMADPKNWLLHPAADGNKGWREFLPFRALK